MPRAKSFNENEVLTKAMQLFWTKGYKATSVQDLVDNLGINRASLYDTFGDKESLFRKAFEQYRSINTYGLLQFFQNHPSVKEGFTKLFEIVIDEGVNDLDSKGCFVVNTTTELVPGDPAILKLLQENKSNIEALYYEYLKRGRDLGEINSDKNLKSVATLLYTFYNGLRVVTKVHPEKEKLMASVREILGLLD